MKKCILVLLAVLVMIMSCACSSQDSFTGTWEACGWQDEEGIHLFEDEGYPKADYSFEFKKDGEVEYISSGTKIEAESEKISDNEYRIEINLGNNEVGEMTLKLDGEYLIESTDIDDISDMVYRKAE